MFPRVSDVIAAIGDLKARGLIRDYALAGAFALSIWDEVTATFDIDVLVLVDGTNDLVLTLEPLYDWAAERGYPAHAEHIEISGVPVQFIPTPTPLAEEAVAQAKTVTIDNFDVRVVSPEYLSALWLQPPASSAVRKARAVHMREVGLLDETLLADLMARYNLSW